MMDSKAMALAFASSSGWRGVFRDPASKDVVGAHDRSLKIEELDRDVLAEVLQRDGAVALVVVDEVRPLLGTPARS